MEETEETVFGPSVEISWVNAYGKNRATCFEVIFSGPREPDRYRVVMHCPGSPEEWWVRGATPGLALLRCVRGFTKAFPDVKIRKVHYSMPEL